MSYIQTTPWRLGNPVKTYHGITERLHLIDPRPTELPKEQLFSYSQDFMINGGPILLSAIAICETFKTSYGTGKLLEKDDSESHSKVP